MKCETCGKKIETTFLQKIIGTYLKDMKGKKHAVCFECQKNHSKEDFLKKIS